MAKNSITPEKLAQVQKMVQEQKAKADAQKATKKALQPAKPAKEVNPEKTERNAQRVAKKLSRDQERVAKRSELDIKRAAKKAERVAAKAAKQASQGNMLPAWQRKIERLANDLPTRTDNLTALLNLVKDFSDVELTSSLAYVEYERRQRGIRATAGLKANEGQTLAVGDKVLIKNCNSRKFIGQVGIISMVRRIRAFVTVPGFETDAYCFTSDIEVLEPASVSDAYSVNILDAQVDETAPESTGTDG